ncbi:MAG: nucleotidyltransferase domain-containing protein [Lachnospiraceae bacterium]|nr:nucleotidyltransferase domain-containing protein [Lachnospiraceae bacterium]
MENSDNRTIKRQIKSKRQQLALKYAFEKIKNSPVLPYINAVYLFGSCARREEKFSSDVDLLMEIDCNFPKNSELKMELIKLKSAVSSDDIDDPKTDLKIVTGDEWKRNKMLFYRNIREEGIQIWP